MRSLINRSPLSPIIFFVARRDSKSSCHSSREEHKNRLLLEVGTDGLSIIEYYQYHEIVLFRVGLTTGGSGI